MRRTCLVAAAVLVFAGAAHATATDAASMRASGDWRLSAVGGKTACKLTLTLTREDSLDGFEVKAPLACRRAFPALRGVAAWALDDRGGLVLSDARAQPIATFSAQAKGSYQATAPDGRTWRLDPVRSFRALSDELPVVTAPPFGW